MRNRPRLTPGRLRAVVYAVLVHAAVIAVLVVGFRWTQSPMAVVPGKPIDAVVTEEPQKKKLDDSRRRAEEKKRLEEEARKRAEAEKKQQELEARKREEAEHKRVEAEKQRQVELKRKQEEELRQKQEQERRRAEEQKRREDEARKQAEAEKQRLAEEQQRRRKQAEDQLKQNLAAEEQARVEAARAARAASEMDKYREVIRQRVSNRWNQPSNVPGGLKCVVRVRFLPRTWEIVEATIVRGSGNKAFDDSVERAVLASSPLPLPSNPDLFEYFGELQFEFEPKTR